MVAFHAPVEPTRTDASAKPAPAKPDPISAEMVGELVETAIITSDSAFWPSLAVLEEIDVDVAGCMPVKKRKAMRVKLDRAREVLLFDRRLLAATIALDVERRLAAIRILNGHRP